MTNPGSMLKYTRGSEHLNALVDLVEAWMSETTYKTVSVLDPKSSGLVRCQNYVAEVRGPELPELADVLGDCLHNFRGELDHVIWFASTFPSGDPPRNPRDVGFPLSLKKSSYAGKGLHAVTPSVSAIVETLQPYHAGDKAKYHPLWILSELNRIDKHREVHAVSYAALISEITVSNLPFGSSFEAVEIGPIEDELVLARVLTPSSQSQSDVTVNIEATHAVAIMETETTPFVPLISTLNDIRDAVWTAASGVISALVTDFGLEQSPITN
jgi:hypothetical protein